MNYSLILFYVFRAISRQVTQIKKSCSNLREKKKQPNVQQDWKRNQQNIKSKKKRTANIPEETVIGPAAYADNPRQDKHQKAEATHHTQHHIERVWNASVRTGRWGYN